MSATRRLIENTAVSGQIVEIPSEIWWAAAYGVCPGTAGVARVSVKRVARYSTQRGRKSLEREISEKENPCLVQEFWGFCQQKTNSPKRGCRK